MPTKHDGKFRAVDTILSRCGTGIENHAKRALGILFERHGARDQVAEALMPLEVGGRVVEVDGLDGDVGGEGGGAEGGEGEVVGLCCCRLWRLGGVRYKVEGEGR